MKLYSSRSPVYLRVRELGAELGLQLAELLVGPEEEDGVGDARSAHAQYEHVVALGGVALLQVVHGNLQQAAVRGLPGK